jgi:hypothetical protein
MFRGIVKKAVAGAAAAAAVFVAVGALGFTLFYALRLAFVPVAAAAITFAVFAVVAGVIAAVFLKDPDDLVDDEDDEPHSLASRAVHLIRERPILGAVGGLGALFLLLRNPAMAAIAASLITERRMERKGYGRRR